MARRTSLKEFQETLAAKLRDARGEAAPMARIGVRAADQYWLVRLSDAGEVLSPPEVTPVPLTQGWFLGLANVRGKLACVVDFAAFLGEAPTERTPACRLLLAADRFGAQSGLLVAGIVGLRNIDGLVADNRAPPYAWVTGCYRDADGRRWNEFDFGALVAHPDYVQAGI